MKPAISAPIVSPKQASRITLVPNREILQRRIAERLVDRVDGDVIVAPPVYMLSAWVEEIAVTLRQLAGDDVPRSQDAVGGLLEWTRPDAGGGGAAFSISAARQARSADRLLRQWQASDAPGWVAEGFFGWRQQVRAAMESAMVFSAEDWLSDLTQRLSGSDRLPLELPEAVLLEGFVEFTPLERTLFEALESRGVEVGKHSPSAGDSEVRVNGFETPQDEWRAAARWARDRFDSGLTSICVVVPAGMTLSGPESRRIRQAFCQAFDRNEPDLADEASCPFFIASAGRLSACRSVIDALLLVRLAVDGPEAPQPFPVLSQWLLSPYWADADVEHEARAQLEIRLRRRGLYRLSLNEVTRLARAEKLQDRVPALLERVRKLEGASSSESSATLHATLEHWGWPGAARGRAISAQAERLYGLLERIAALRPATVGKAIGLLKAACEDVVMPLGGGPLSPVQVLTPEIAVGGRFDALWLCQADDVNWPPPIAVNPYVPAWARRAIPRMNPEGLFGYYRNLTDMLCGVSPEVRISWSEDAGQGPRGPSGLVAELSGSADAVAQRAETPAVETRPALEAIEDGAGVAYPDGGEIELPGGADFFSLQAACPLMAYARYRLGAEFPPMPGPMPDSAFRGILLHRALRLLYEGEGDARGIPGANAIPKAVQAVLSDAYVRSRLTATGLRAEEGRLRRALASWLELDASRDGFAVEALECPQVLHVGRAVLHTRFDRLDRLDDGRVFLVDYKSGRVLPRKALKWLRERIQDVQLPLYAVGFELAGEGQVGGLALASVRPGDCALVGVSDHTASAGGDIRVVGEGRGAERNWQWGDLVRHWREQAMSLCEEILAGNAENRVHDEGVLRYTDLSLILRHDSGFELPNGAVKSDG